MGLNVPVVENFQGPIFEDLDGYKDILVVQNDDSPTGLDAYEECHSEFGTCPANTLTGLTPGFHGSPALSSPRLAAFVKEGDQVLKMSNGDVIVRRPNYVGDGSFYLDMGLASGALYFAANVLTGFGMVDLNVLGPYTAGGNEA